jgi:pimeloyl-ACP methyl ester carboxylesterase
MSPRVLWAGLIFAILVVAGITYEQVERRRDRRRFPQVGRSIDIGGRSLNLFCSGEGSPAVILESDALVPGYAWTAVQREIARFTRACWYDRAGYGWSDPAPAPHTSRDSARDLHALLHAAPIAPPYILVARGFGGFNVRVYHGLYPADVAGVVLVDAEHEDELTLFPEERGMAGRIPLHLGFPPDLVLRTVTAVGMMRMMNHGGRPIEMEGLTAAEQATLAGLARLPKQRAAFLAEQAFASGPEQARAAGPLGDLPLTVLTPDDAVEDARHIARLDLQERLARLSTRGRQLTLTGNASLIQAVREMCRK